MKEFFEEVKTVLEEESKKNEPEEESYIISERENKDAIINLTKEMQSDSKTELKIIGLATLITTIVIILIASVFLLFKKNFTKNIEKSIDEIILKTEKILDKGESLFPNIGIKTQVINCQKPYNSNYEGEYIINNQNFKETLSIYDTGKYSLTTSNTKLSGSYLLSNKTITLNEENSSNANYIYQISEDCKTLTRYQNDGTTIILNIK